ncbi:MAG: hypothetical protein O7C75_01610, partial [Verrucomicrobia bacterium]|nr:hypothetical protein [Verrucomicrobiota bacterium]
EKLFVFKETTVFMLNILVLGAAGVITLAGLVHVFKRQPRLTELSNKVEQAHPELMDSLNAAVDVAKVPPSQRGPIERLLIDSVEEKTASYDLEKILIPRHLSFYVLSGTGLLAIALLVFAHFFDASQKFRYHLGDWVRGESTGFYVSPKPLEVARNEDLRVFVTPRRWDQQCTIEFLENGQRVQFPMNAAGNSRSDFVFYDVSEDFQFRVQTESLTSPWYSVLAYDPPVIDLFQLSVEPPAYSGYQPEYYDAMKDLEILEGTLLSFDLAGASIEELAVEFWEEALPLQKNEAGTFGFDMRPDESTSLRFVMFNETGHRAQTDTVQLKVLPDEKPVLEWIQPGKDITVKPEDMIPLELFVADDFGLDAVILNLSISGTRQTSIAMHAGDPDREPGPIEFNLFEALDLFELEVLDGDVITYSATAMDNKKPEPNLVRSEVFFIEVRVAKEPIELEGMDGEGETREVDVRALVIELKRIIRDTYAALGLPPDENQFANQEIGTDLASLRNVIETVMVQAAPILTQQGQDHLMEFLIRAREAMVKAETMINSNATDLAIAPEEQALAELVSFEAELSRNRSNSESESQSESEGDSQGQPPSENEQNQAQDEGPNFAELPKALDDLNSLIDRQNELNEAIDRANRRNATSEELAELAGQQSQLSRDAVEMRDQLERLMPGGPSAPAVDQAAAEMAAGAGQLEEGQPGLAQGSGQRAQQGLMNAATLLEQGINQVASQMMEGLATQGQQLAARERQAAGQSRQADEGELNEEEQAALKEQQQAIAEAFEKWQDRIGQTANQLREQFPEAASDLDSVAEQAEEENLEGRLSRAENALHYRRFGRAAPIQDELAESLDELSEGIEDSASQMPQLADAAVRRALAELQQARQELQEMQAEGESSEGQQQLRTMQGRMSGMLSDLASRFDDPELREFAGELNTDEDPENWSGTVRATDEVLGKAGQVLLERLRSSLRELQLDMLRQSSDPPEQYRSQVEKYFEQLAEESGGSS